MPAECPRCGSGLVAHRYLKGYELRKVAYLSNDTVGVREDERPIEREISREGRMAVYCENSICNWSKEDVVEGGGW